MQQSKLKIAKNIKESKAQNNSSTHSYAYRLLKAFDYVAIIRPLLLIPVWTMVLSGYYRTIKDDLATQIQLPFFGNIGFIIRPHQEILITLLLYSLLMGAIYILNQLTDSKTDSINGKLYLIPNGYLKKNSMKVQIAILLIFSVVLSFLKFPTAYLLLILLSIIMGIAYSLPPIRLKGRPIFDLLANASGFGIIAFSVGWMSKASFSADLILDSIPYFLCISSGFINTTIPDMEGDIRNGDRTTGVFLGIQKSCLISTLILVLAIIAGIYRRDLVPLVASAISLPFFIYMTVSNWGRKTNIRAISLATKISVLTLSLLVSFLIPLYFVVLVLTILSVRLYYQVRFGVNYP